MLPGTQSHLPGAWRLLSWLGKVASQACGYSVGIFRAGGHTGAMGRMVTAVVTHGGACAGVVGPFHVDNPWWAEVESVVTHLEQMLGAPAVVLRLLAVEGSDGARDGHVTYHAEALQPPGDLAPCDFADDDHPLRMPWARASGVQELLRWALGYIDLAGRPVQRKTWNLAVPVPLADRRWPGLAQGRPCLRRRRAGRDRRVR